MAATNEKVSTTTDDIAFSILSKLSLKSFKLFECVRKSWCQIFIKKFKDRDVSDFYDSRIESGKSDFLSFLSFTKKISFHQKIF